MNRDLMLQVADFIEQHPERYDQGIWMRPPDAESDETVSPEVYNALAERGTECGTVGCVAGHAVLLSGTRDLVVTDEYAWNDEAKDVLPTKLVDFRETGQQVLGLGDELARFLFSGGRLEVAMPTLLRQAVKMHSSYGDVEGGFIDYLSGVEDGIDAILERLEKLEEGR